MAGVAAGDIVKAVIVEISQVPGLATQVFSADRILKYVEDAFKLEIDEEWWPQYMHWFGPVPLDGVTGMITQDLTGPLSSIDDYGDIRAAFPDGSNRRIAQLPPMLNPSTLGGTGRLFMEADGSIPHRPLRIWPKTAVGPIWIHARQEVAAYPITDTDTLLIDDLLLTYDAAWMYCVDDGTVPGQVNKYQGLAHKRRQQVIADMAQQPLMLDPRFPDGTDQWWTVP